MSVRGGNQLRRNFERTIARIGGPMTEAVMTEILITIDGHTVPMIPVATSALINSRYRRVTKSGDGFRGVIGYGVAYAAFVHRAPGTLRGMGIMRSPARLGQVWAPKGEPQFLTKGARNAKPDLQSLLRARYKL